jgi:hypothetical protein
MTVYISADAKNLREELASLRNQGGYQEQQFWFDGLVTNGTFDTATTGWTANVSTLAVVSNELEVTSGVSSGWASQAITTIVGKTYVVTGSHRKGTATGSKIYAGRTNGNSSFGLSANATGTNVDAYLPFVATGTLTYIGLQADGASGTAYFDNVSVFETNGTDVIHRLPKGWKPKDVFEDGLLQREGAAYDYEVVYDGFDYYVKPAVAPSATTQTCVIGVKA